MCVCEREGESIFCVRVCDRKKVEPERWDESCGVTVRERRISE